MKTVAFVRKAVTKVLVTVRVDIKVASVKKAYVVDIVMEMVIALYVGAYHNATVTVASGANNVNPIHVLNFVKMVEFV